MHDIMDALVQFRDARRWAKYHTPRNLAEALSVEAGELLECFLWDGEFKQERHHRPESELADVLIYALNLCLALGVNPEAIIKSKMNENARKYPPSESGA